MAPDIHYPGGEIPGYASALLGVSDIAGCLAICQTQAACVIAFWNAGQCFLKNQAIKANLELTWTNVFTAYKHCVAGERSLYKTGS